MNDFFSVSNVQQHKLDMNSLEVNIAIDTVKIRNYQHALVQQWPYKNQPMKNNLTYTIAKRRKHLGELFHTISSALTSGLLL